MKTKLIFTLLGATLMFICLKLVDALNLNGQATIHPKTSLTQSNQTASEQSSSVLIKQNTVKSNVSPEQTPECLPSEISYADAMTKIAVEMFNNNEYTDAISQMEIAILTKQLRSIESIDEVRLEQIKIIAKNKVDADLKSSHELNSDPYMLNSMTMLNNDQSPSALENNEQLLANYNKKNDQAIIDREQTRVVYEDHLRNILNYEELQQYQKNESAVAQRRVLSEIKNTHKMLSNEYIQLDVNQKEKLDNLMLVAQQNASTLLPIGFSLGNSDGLYEMSLNDLSDDDIYLKMFDLLSPKQEQLYEEYSLSLDYDDPEFDY